LKVKNFAFKRKRSLRIELLVMNAICGILLMAVSAHATTYTVKAGGGGNYTTIQACAATMSAGDTCMVYAGTYSENVSVPAGTLGSVKTLTVNGSDVVYILGTVTLNSYTSIVGNCTANSDSTYGTCGFSVGEPSSPSSGHCVALASNASTVRITNNSFYACGPYMVSEPTSSSTDNVYIGGNTFAYSCSTSSSPNVCNMMQINGTHQLIENNDFSHVGDGPYLNGEWIVLRHNTMHDIETTDCGSNSGNCHIDFMQADQSGGTTGEGVQHILLENNTITNMLANGGSVSGAGVHATGLFQNSASASNFQYGIVRFQNVSHVDGGGLFNDTNNWAYLKTYNDNYIDINRTLNQSGELFDTFSAGMNASAVNNLYYITVPLKGLAVYGCGSATCSTFTYGHSLAYCTSTGCSSIYGDNYGTASFTSGPGNVMANPLFVNYSANNFNLSAGSPAIATGTYLTTVASGDSGTGTSLVVTDAAYFQDGSGIASVNGDCVSVTTVTNHVCVKAVNYSTNTLTLASGITRSSGDSVWLYSDSSGRQVLSGSAPNIGASVPNIASSPAPAPSSAAGLAGVAH
jgi:hypothetical protein